jgi:hypothetical protein
MPRRALITRGSGVALGAAVVWSAPSVRTIALRAGAAGTPPPGRPTTQSASNSANGVVTDPGASTAVGVVTDPGASDGVGGGSGTLPLTGIDPRPLLMAGGTAIVAGGALVAIAHDAEPVRGES